VIPLALERAQRRKHAAIAAGAAVLIVAVLLALAHFFFLPLDVLLMKALIRLG
jgi:hypothetical protein